MNGENVNLEDMLNWREERVNIQNIFLSQYHCPVISFCMNIPGPIKTNEDILTAFISGKECLLDELSTLPACILNHIEVHKKTGDELILSVDYPAEKIKELTTRIEETHPLGRLFDMDVIDRNGQKLSRNTWRKCIICGCQAQECARSKRHSIAEMQSCIQKMINNSDLQN